MIYLVADHFYWECIPGENRTLCGRVKRVEKRQRHYNTVRHIGKASAVADARQRKECVIRESNRGENWDYELLINFEKPNG